MAIKKVATGDWIGGEFVHQPWATGVDQVGDPEGNLIGSAADSGWTDDGAVVRLTTFTDSVGIGTVVPQQKLHVQGAIVIGPKTADIEGAIQWTGTRFQGWNGVSWVNLDETGGGGSGSLDDAYDIGRTITADAGPMVLASTSAQALQIDQSVSGNAIDLNCTHGTANGIDLSITTGIGIKGITDTGKLIDFTATGTTTINPMVRLALDAVTYTGAPWAVIVDYSAATINTPIPFGAFTMVGRKNNFVGAYTAAVLTDENWDYSLVAKSDCLIDDDKKFWFGDREFGVWVDPAPNPNLFRIQGVNSAGATAQIEINTGTSNAGASGNSGGINIYSGDALAAALETSYSGHILLQTGDGVISTATATAHSGTMGFRTGDVSGSVAGAIQSGGVYIRSGHSSYQVPTTPLATTGEVQIRSGNATSPLAGVQGVSGSILVKTGDSEVWSTGAVVISSGDIPTGNVLLPITGDVTVQTGQTGSGGSEFGSTGNLHLKTGAVTGTGGGIRGYTDISGSRVYIGGDVTATGGNISEITLAPTPSSTAARIGTGVAAPTAIPELLPPNNPAPFGATPWPDGSLYIQTSAGGKLWFVVLGVWTQITVP